MNLVWRSVGTGWMVQSNYRLQESGIHPCSQKTKPDTLFQQFKIQDCPWNTATIHLKDGMMGAVTWNMEREAECAHLKVQIHDGCVPCQLFSSPEVG